MWVRPTLHSHVRSVKHGMALVDAALTEMQGLTDGYDDALTELRRELTYGPTLPGCCRMCGAPSLKASTCQSCKDVLRRELVLLKRKHGPPPDSNRCDVCHRVSKRTLCLDHHHGSGKARVWACNRCNAALALFDANPGAFLRHVAALGGN